MNLQLSTLFPKLDQLQLLHGDQNFNAIYGAGDTHRPKVILVFMNPTSKNISANPAWNGIRAPWCGTKNIWKMLYQLNLINKTVFQKTQTIKPSDWNEDFVENLYREISKQKIYITNLAKCTQIDARPLKDKVFREYLELMRQELAILQPEKVITFGNQVSSILLEKSISVSNYLLNEFEPLEINDQTFQIYPTYYPVGQGMRNMSKAIERIRQVLRQ